jgi:hypothetical protein
MPRTYGADDLKGKKVFKEGRAVYPWDKVKPKEKPAPKPAVKVALPPPVVVQAGMSAEDGLKIAKAATDAANALIDSVKDSGRTTELLLSLITQMKEAKPPTEKHKLIHWKFKVTKRTSAGISDVLATPIYKKNK